MRVLIVEDDFTSRLVLQRQLSPYGEVHIAVSGEEAIGAFKAALEANQPYDLVCLDIVLPGKDGQAVLGVIRDIEANAGRAGLDRSKIVMTTSLSDSKSIMKAFTAQCEGYLIKPIDSARLKLQLIELGLVPDSVI